MKLLKAFPLVEYADRKQLDCYMYINQQDAQNSCD